MSSNLDDLDDAERADALSERSRRGRTRAATTSTPEEYAANLRHPDCIDERCGQPWPGAGRKPKGWVKAGHPHAATGERWWCTWLCLARGAVVLALRGEDAA